MRAVVTVVLVIVLGGSPAHGQSVTLIPPVDAPISMGFEQPASSFGPGHRGIDLGVPTGTAVRAAAAGTVTFAGAIPGGEAVTIDHGGGWETTYSILAATDVAEGSYVSQGQIVGRAGVAHSGGDPGLHLGVRSAGVYVDPRPLLARLDPVSAIRLVPLEGNDDTYPARSTVEPAAPSCNERYDLGRAASPPNDNLAVVVAGIDSSSSDRELTEAARALGFADEDIFLFSYRGTSGSRLHTPYRREDTWGDLRGYADGLATMLRELRRVRPEAEVDLIAHSQGGIVARIFLETLADVTDPGLPRVEHLVTFSTPHLGAPLAGEAEEMASALGYQHIAGKALSEAARRGWLPVPDLYSEAVGQLAEDSPVIRGLREEILPFGTRYLSLAMADDAIVPADRTKISRGMNRTVRFGWSLNGHSKILDSSQGRALAYDFLRDADPSCTGSSESWGSVMGGALSGMQGLTSELVGLATGMIPGSAVATTLHGAARVIYDPASLPRTAYDVWGGFKKRSSE